MASSEKESVVAEAANRLAAMKPEQFIKDPYVLEFIDLKDYPALHESGLEQVLIDLKVGKLTHGDVGQMDSYIRMFDDLMRRPDDNPTIGLILCSEKTKPSRSTRLSPMVGRCSHLVTSLSFPAWRSWKVVSWRNVEALRISSGSFRT